MRQVAARLDDEAYDASQFIHKLGEVQQQEFDKLWERVESKGWMKGFDDSEDARGFLWDYCFNRSNDKDDDRFLQAFSEMCDAEWMLPPPNQIPENMWTAKQIAAFKQDIPISPEPPSSQITES